MSETPRLRSAWPPTPQSTPKRPSHRDGWTGPQAGASPAPVHKTTASPTIPSSFLDAPSQRFYVALLYLVLNIWRVYDYSNLLPESDDSFWLFTKWVGIDTAFLYSLSGLNIPWLQWSSSTFTVLFIGHAAINWLLMFHVSVPLLAWTGTLTRLLYDREYVLSERYVKPASVIRNSSVILGKQIIHILPEGSVMLNPDRTPYCIGGTTPSTELHIRINQTNPIYMEMLRIDLSTNERETIGISAKELKKMQRLATRDTVAMSPSSYQLLRYPVKQSGLYRLQSVMDESKLEVRRQPSDALVVQCPTASVQVVPSDKCKGDLSNFYLSVNATPPFKIRYSKVINRDDHGHTVLSIPSEDSSSPLTGKGHAGAVMAHTSSTEMDVSWARAQSILIPLNESLGVTGAWQYQIDEVQDGCGNTANYSDSRNLESFKQLSPQSGQLEQHFSVHGNPAISFYGCDTQNPVKARVGSSEVLPLQVSAVGDSLPGDETCTLKYLFTRHDDIMPDQRHPETATLRDVVVKGPGQGRNGLEARDPGLYTLHSVNSAYCQGEVLEPSSCQLMNPLKPDLSLSAEQIPDRCAGNSIGLLVDLDLVGTPPFRLSYTTRLLGEVKTQKVVEIDRYHTQLELKPSQAGHYIYEFERISDSVYTSGRALNNESFVLEQDVRPPASAFFLDERSVRKACIEETVSFYVYLFGKPPYSLEYELLHHGRRHKRTIQNIQDELYELKTEPLTEGGDYTLSLLSIIDVTACKRSLEAEAHFSVGLQRPRASFGVIENKRNTFALENKKVGLPLRLQGEAPWTLTYKKASDSVGKTTEIELRKSNDQIQVSEEGIYEIVGVRDKTCPGSVDPSANTFAVQWIARPQISVPSSPLIEVQKDGQFKKAVCEGDEDVFELSFTGTAPFNVEYEQRYKPERGSQSTTTKKFTAGLDSATIQMETSESGLYTYHFTKLGDMFYNHERRKFSPVKIEQRVHPRPSASFTNTGKTYKFCKNQQGSGDTVSINLVGMPPFHLELEVKHSANAKPERINIPDIESNRYNLHLPQRVLSLGSHSVTIRKVGDSRGCQRSLDYNAPYIHVMVADIPTISPLEEQHDFCVGDRITYALSGTPPFNVYYTFQGHERKAKVSGTEFRRLAEQPGEFLITALSDVRSTDTCKAQIEILRTVHEMPSVRVSKGRTSTIDIHEGGKAEILFEFGGTPPFHFTYTRSTTSSKGKKGTVLETKNGISHDHSMTIEASDEGTYEVVSIRDRFCAYSSEQAQGKSNQKLLKNG